MRPSRRRVVVLLAPVVLAALAAPAGAAPAGASATVLTVSGHATKALRAPGLKVGAAGPATARGRRVTVPVATIGAGARPTVVHGAAAGLRLRRAGRAVVVRGLRVDLRRRTVRARVGRRTITAFALTGVRVATAAD
ncbi:hypothetical protein ACVU7I_19035, partial [Patulibacter sp. S7RM1-6]